MTDARVVNPPWLRLWHGAQAVAFLGLLTTGLSMHFADSGWAPVPFRTAVLTHNACGLTSAALWLIFVVLNVRSGNARHYVPRTRELASDLARQIGYYAWGMFRGALPPFPPGFQEKFNPVQKLAYLLVMYVLMPLSLASGCLLLFPLLAPARALGQPGLWPMAMLHLTVGYLLAIFLIFHIYLATTGDTVGTMFREMATGLRTSSAPPPPAADDSSD